MQTNKVSDQHILYLVIVISCFIHVSTDENVLQKQTCSNKSIYTCIFVVDHNIGLIAFIVAFPIICLIFRLIPIFKLLSELRSKLVLY